MAKLISSGNEIGFTCIPYSLDRPVQEELIAHPSDYVLGFMSRNNNLTFTYTESGSTQVTDHWSLSILKEFPYCEQETTWIVYICPPETATVEFSKLLTQFHQHLHVYNWDTWSIKGKDSTVAVITSWEIF
jgi:hypothetical protein